MTNPTPLRDIIAAADPLDRSAFVALADLEHAADELDELRARIEAATDVLQTEFHQARWVDTHVAEVVARALHELAGQPDGADR